MTVKAFVDTNILVYAHDLDAEQKHERARGVVEDLWNSRSGALSTQVLQEFYVNVTRKIPRPISRSIARDLVQAYARWDLVIIDASRIQRASDLEERHKLSFWDALIVIAAQDAGATRLLSEDLTDGQRFGALRVEDPFSA
jgi:predicted nucleic acid-binding protein